MAPPPDAVDEAEDGGEENVVFVSQKLLEDLGKKLKDGAEITVETLDPLTSPNKLADEDIIVPVDLRGLDATLGVDEDDIVNEDMQIDIKRIVAKIGAKATAEAFIEGKRCFDANAGEQPDDEKPEAITVKEWKKMIEGSDSEIPDLGSDEGGESEEEDGLEMDGSDLEFEDEEEEEDTALPNAKKPRTA